MPKQQRLYNVKEILIRSQYLTKWGCRRVIPGTTRTCKAMMPDAPIDRSDLKFKPRPQNHDNECVWAQAWYEYQLAR